MTATNLLKADFRRIGKDKALLITLLVGAGLLILTVLLLTVAYLLLREDDGLGFELLGNGLGRMGLMMFFDTGSFVLIGVVAISIFTGGEFAFNTIRNKIIAGNSRLKIYFSQLLINIVIFFVMFAAYFIVMLALCALIFPMDGAADIALRFLIALPLYLCIVAIATFVVMALKSRTAGVVTNLLLIMLLPTVLSMVTLFLANGLSPGEAGALTAGEIAIAILESNPFSMLTKTLGGDFASLGSLFGVSPALETGVIIKSLAVAVVYGGGFTALGAFLFKRADIK